MGRLAVVVTVPTLAIAAHGAASGAIPGLGGIALCLMTGVLAGVCTGRRCGAVVLLTVLSAAQFLSHLALAVTMPAAPVSAMPAGSMAGMDHHGMNHAGMNHAGMDHAGMSMPAGDHGGPLSMVADHLAEMFHLGGADGTTMLLTHLIAIPLCALLIAAAVAVFTVITSVLAALRRSPAPAVGHVVTVVVATGVVRRHRIDRAAGAGERGPPLLIA